MQETRDSDSIPRSERSPEEGNGNPLQYSCLENPHKQRNLAATVHGVAKCRTRLKRLSRQRCYHQRKELGARGMCEAYELWGEGGVLNPALCSRRCIWGAFCLCGHQGNELKRTRWNPAGGSMSAQCKMDSILVFI